MYWLSVRLPGSIAGGVLAAATFGCTGQSVIVASHADAAAETSGRGVVGGPTNADSAVPVPVEASASEVAVPAEDANGDDQVTVQDADGDGPADAGAHVPDGCDGGWWVVGYGASSHLTWECGPGFPVVCSPSCGPDELCVAGVSGGGAVRDDAGRTLSATGVCKPLPCPVAPTCECLVAAFGCPDLFGLPYATCGQQNGEIVFVCGPS
jgi:hypothetical protein